MKLINQLRDRPANKRFEFLQAKIGKSRRGFWDTDGSNTYWLLMTRSYNDCVKLKDNVKYVAHDFHTSDSDEHVYKRIHMLKKCDNIFMYCSSKQRVWQVRFFKINEKQKKFIFQVVYEYNLESDTKMMSKKLCKGQKLMNDFFV